MEDIQVLKVNDEMPMGPPVKPIPDSMMTPVSEDKAAILVRELSKPIECEYHQGEYISIVSPKDDPYWSVNIKRGVVNIFKFDLQQKTTLKDRVEIPYAVRDAVKARFLREKQLIPVYSTMEYGVDGKCESIYAIGENPIPESGKQLFKFTKIRNYKNCEEKPSLQNTILYGTPCAGCEAKQKMSIAEAFSHVDYVLEGNINNYIVKKAVLEGHYVFLPFSQDGGSVRTFMTQEFELMRSRDVPEDEMFDLLSDTRSRVGHPLVYEFPQMGAMTSWETPEAEASSEEASVWSWMSPGTASKDAPATAGMEMEKLQQKVMALLRNEIAPMCREELKSELPKKIAELTMYLRVHEPSLIHYVINECVSKAATTEDEKNIRKLVLDLLPTLGTHEAALALSTLIKTRVLTGFAAVQAINSMALVSVPTPAVIDTLLEIVSMPATVERMEKEAALLTAGAIIRHWRATVIQNKIPASSVSLMEHKIIKRLKVILKASTEDHHLQGIRLVAALKCIGNTAIPEFATILVKIAKDETKPIPARTQAIYSLRHIAKVIPRKIQSTCLTLLVNPVLDEDIRVAAYMIIMETTPSMGMLQMIVHGLKTEKNVQIASFVYTHLRCLSRTVHPCYKREARAARIALLVARPVEWALQYSKTIHAEFGNRILNFGSAMDIFMLNKRSSLIPHAVTAKIDNLIFDYSVPMEAGFTISGLQSMIRRLYAEKELRSVWDISLKDILEPMKMSYSSTLQQKLRNIFGKMSSAKAAEPWMSIYAKMFGSELQYYMIDKTVLNSMFAYVRSMLDNLETKLVKGMPINYQKTMSLFDVANIIPTPLGLPVTLNMTMTGALKFKGMVRGDISPSIATLRSRSHLSLPETAKLHMDLEPSMVMEACVATGVDLNFVKSSAVARTEVASSVPLKSVIEADMKNQKLTVSLKVPEEMRTAKRNMVTAKVTPVTCVYEAPTAILSDLSDNSEITEKTILNKKAYIEKIEGSVGREALGMEIGCTIERTVRKTMKAPYHPLCGPFMIRVDTSPGTNAPTTLMAQFKYESDAPEAAGIRRRRSIFSKITGIFLTPENNDEEAAPSSRWPVDNKGFTPITKSSLITSPITRQLVARISAEGPVKREVKCRCVCVSDAAKNIHQIDIQAVTSAIPGVCAEPKKMVITTLWKTDMTPVSSYLWSASTTEKVVEATVNVLSGPMAAPVQRIAAKVLVQKSNAPLEGRSSEETVLSVKMEIEHNKLAPSVVNVMRACYAALKYRLYSNMATIYKSPADVAPKKIIMELEARAISRKVHMVLDMPTEINKVTYECPIAWPEISSEKRILEHALTTMMKKPYPAICKVSPQDKLTSFDRTEMYLPSVPGCEMELAKDCTPERSFAILAYRPTNAPTKKVIKLIALGHKVELDISSWSPELKIDDRVVRSPHVYLRKSSSDPKSPVLIEIKRENEQTVVYCKALGLTLQVESKTVVIKAAPWLHGVTCGLCGNNNGDKIDEKIDHKTRTVLTKDEICAKYLIPSDTCRVKELYPNVKVPVRS